jgi:hypothetical protein
MLQESDPKKNSGARDYWALHLRHVADDPATRVKFTMYANQIEQELARQNILLALEVGWIEPERATAMLSRLRSMQSSINRKRFNPLSPPPNASQRRSR